MLRIVRRSADYDRGSRREREPLGSERPTMTRRRSVKYRRFAVLALGVLAFAVAGCGGDDSTSASSDETQVEETTEVETTADETTEEETTGDETSSLDDVDLGDLSGECLEFAGIGAKIAEAMGGATGGTADVSETAELFEQLVDSAPDEIKDDLEVLSESIAKMAVAFEGVDFASGATPSADQLAKIQEVMTSIDNVELQAASKNIEAWASANCTNS
jgi:hypothetical protein